MKLFILFVLLSITSVSPLLFDETNQTKFTECEGGPYPNTITNILISPNPLVIGQSASYTFNGTRNVEILKGSTIEFLIIDENYETMLKKKDDFCSIVETTDKKCPLPIGDYEFTYGLNINSNKEPSSEDLDKPPKTFLFQLIIRDPEENFLSCIQGPVDLSYVFIASNNGP
ncbi:hypothetical protein RclHR1_03110019 [Rhizophagus clarus]|uniref:Phosphatidylglycerol/phosphatidylinositol transfer protein n=1 Tax=Rhizophagus clarus TaxID=94130 RepID=A0A2Z6R6G2_9GLOM|nr:hypothetical protein RclHR1_03110019 [Rhizophagus clarus]GES88293.1 putative phosphatidylglycerol/ phosphatidylinositol transfer protein DDB_G0282179 [Rhizophagus clarus]